MSKCAQYGHDFYTHWHEPEEGPCHHCGLTRLQAEYNEEIEQSSCKHINLHPQPCNCGDTVVAGTTPGGQR